MDPLSQILMQRAAQPPTQGVPPSAPQQPFQRSPDQHSNSPMGGFAGFPPGLQNSVGPTGPNQMGGPQSGPSLGAPVQPSVGSPMPPQTPPPPPPGPPATPPNPMPRVPQIAQRFQNTQAIQDAYRNPSWQPNPVLLQASLAGK